MHTIIRESHLLDTEVGKLVANLYLPENISQPPLVIVTGAWTTVKEQMPTVYAKAMAALGFAALVFDFRGWGESKDTLQYLESPQRKIEDLKAVMNMVDRLPHVNSAQVFGLGICASAGYMLEAIMGHPKVTGAAVVAPWLHNSALVAQIYGGQEGVDKLLQLSDLASQSDHLQLIEAASLANENALMYQAPYYTEPERGLIAEFDNLFNLASWRLWLEFDPIANAKYQDKPVLMICSESMALPAGAKAYQTLAADNVRSIELDGVSQFDFYDQAVPVSTATNAIALHFHHLLNRTA